MVDRCPAQAMAGAACFCRSGPCWALIGIVLGLIFLADKQASANIAAWLYDLIGNSREANALRSGGGDRFSPSSSSWSSRWLVGVGGIWLIYAGLNVIVERLSASAGPRGSCPGSSSARRCCCWRSSSSGRRSPRLPELRHRRQHPPPSVDGRQEPASTTGSGASPTRRTTRSTGTTSSGSIVGTAGSVGLGLLIAGLVDRVKHESLAKTFIFLPLAISLVGASVIWQFVYAWQPAGTAAVRPPERRLDGLRREARAVDPDAAPQHLPDDRHPHLAADRLRHGRALGGHQGRARRRSPRRPASTAPRSASCSSKRHRADDQGSLVTVTITVAIVTLKIFDIVYA